MKQINLSTELQLYHGWTPAQVQGDAIWSILHGKETEVCILGARGGGKDLTLGSALVDYCSANDDYKVLFVCAYYKQVENFWNQVLRAINKKTGDYWVPQVFEINESKKEVRFFNGSLIACASADNPTSIRSNRADMVVVNEAAFIPKSVIEMEILPCLRKGGKIVYVSSPNGKNWFYKKYLEGLRDVNDKYYIASMTDESVISFKFTYKNNPEQANDIDKLRKIMTTKVFLREMEGEFLDDNSVFMDLEKAFFKTSYEMDGEEKWQGELPVKARTEIIKDEKGKDVKINHPAEAYVMGVDFAYSNDYTVIYIMAVTTGKVVYWERFNKIHYTHQAKKILALAHLYNDAIVCYDATGVGISAGHSLNAEVFANNQYRLITLSPQTFTNAFKSEIIQTLALRIETPNEFQSFIPEIPVILHEMRILEGTTTQSNMVRYSAPDGEHDDCVMALALCNWMWEGQRVQPSIGTVSIF